MEVPSKLNARNKYITKLSLFCYKRNLNIVDIIVIFAAFSSYLNKSIIWPKVAVFATKFTIQNHICKTPFVTLNAFVHCGLSTNFDAD